VNVGSFFENLRRLVRTVFQVSVELKGLQETRNGKEEKQGRKDTTHVKVSSPQDTSH
jgi:hypothetical protein